MSIAQIVPARGTGEWPEVADPAFADELVAEVAARAGEVEAAEWALDQAEAACLNQIRTAVCAGADPARVAEAAGMSEPELAELVRSAGADAVSRDPVEPGPD